MVEKLHSKIQMIMDIEKKIIGILWKTEGINNKG